MTELRTVERFKRKTIWFHWVHTAAFLTLTVTGAILFLPGCGAAAAHGYTRLIHRIAALLFGGVPLIYFIMNPRLSFRFIKETFTWGKDDKEWVRRAPDYYFGGDEEKMLPQGHINTGQKMWQVIVLVSGALFLVSGLIMWFLRNILEPDIFQWAVIVHDVAFILSFLMLLVHVYLGVIHPRMTESLSSMWDGKISEEYARNHYGKWYDEVAGRNR
jgi:formate dehydrogenase subunit gamma